MFLLLYDNIFSTNAILQAKYSHTLTILFLYSNYTTTILLLRYMFV